MSEAVSSQKFAESVLSTGERRTLPSGSSSMPRRSVPPKEDNTITKWLKCMFITIFGPTSEFVSVKGVFDQSDQGARVFPQHESRDDSRLGGHDMYLRGVLVHCSQTKRASMLNILSSIEISAEKQR